MRRAAPRPLAPALDSLLSRIAPPTTLAAVQGVWAAAVGSGVAAHATPAAESGGILTVTCDEAVWANEIDLMGPELVVAINSALGGERLSAVSCRGAVAARPRPGRPGRRT